MADSGTVRQLIANGGAVDEALRKAAAAARREYVRAGLSMPVWRRGRLVWVEPTELKQYEADGHAATFRHEGAEGNGAI
jgi:hypothetical protein